MKNRYEILGEITVVYVKTKNSGEIEFIIDSEDLPIVAKIRNSWCVNSSDPRWIYFSTKTQKNHVRTHALLHRLITNCPDGLFVDHINHNTLDNRKSNLRIVTKQGNNLNLKGARKDHLSTGIRGVYYKETRKNWYVTISYNHIQYQLGTYDSEEKAAIVAQRAHKLTGNLELKKEYITEKLEQMESSYRGTRASRTNKHSKVRNVWCDIRYNIYYVVIQKKKKVFRYGGFKQMDIAIKIARHLRNRTGEYLEYFNVAEYLASEAQLLELKRKEA